MNLSEKLFALAVEAEDAESMGAWSLDSFFAAKRAEQNRRLLDAALRDLAAVTKERDELAESLAYEEGQRAAWQFRAENAEEEVDTLARCDALCADVEADRDRLDVQLTAARAELERYRERDDALNWGTTCLNCASLLDRNYEDYLRAERAEAAMQRLREALAGHPHCDIHADDDLVTCGWKRAVADVQTVVGEWSDQ